MPKDGGQKEWVRFSGGQIEFPPHSVASQAAGALWKAVTQLPNDSVKLLLKTPPPLRGGGYAWLLRTEG